MSVVTPVPEGNNERAAKRWHRRQELQGIFTSLGMASAGLVIDLEQNEIIDRVTAAGKLIQEAMELLSPTPPKPRIRIREKPKPWER